MSTETKNKATDGEVRPINALVIPTEAIRDLAEGWYAIKAKAWKNEKEELYIHVNQRGDIRMPGAKKHRDVLLILGEQDWDYRRVHLPAEL